MITIKSHAIFKMAITLFIVILLQSCMTESNMKGSWEGLLGLGRDYKNKPMPVQPNATKATVYFIGLYKQTNFFMIEWWPQPSSVQISTKGKILSFDGSKRLVVGSIKRLLLSPSQYEIVFSHHQYGPDPSQKSGYRTFEKIYSTLTLNLAANKIYFIAEEYNEGRWSAHLLSEEDGKYYLL